MSPGALVAAWAIALFGAGALVIAAYGAKHRARAGELWAVYASTVAIAAAVLVPIAIHPLVFAACAWRCAIEIAETYAVPVRGAWREALGAVALAAALWGTLSSPYAQALLFAATVALIAATAPLYARAFRRAPSGATARLLSVAFPLVAAAHLARLAHLPDGFAWVFVLYATVESQDSAAYLGGRLFGRRLLLPRLSPKKTVAGAVVGALVGIAVGAGAAWALLDLVPMTALGVAALIVVAGFCGDLYTSAVKRGAGVKDFPAVHRLHGGLLDIYDSTLFAGVFLSIGLYIISAWTF